MSQDRRNFLKHVGAGAAAAAAVVKVSEAAAQGQEVTASVLSSARSIGICAFSDRGRAAR